MKDTHIEPAGIYGLESQGRSLCSHTAESDITRFFIGTLSTRSPGQIHQLDFDEESNSVKRKVYKPQIGEIWQIQSCPASAGAGVLGLVTNQIEHNKSQMLGSLWKLPDFDKDADSLDLQQIATLMSNSDDLKTQNVTGLDWHPTREGKVCTVLEDNFLIWDLDDGTGTPQVSFDYKSSDGNKIYTGKWNPHLDGNQYSLISGSTVSAIDLRSKEEAWRIPKAHSFQVRDLDFNPNKQYMLGTCGDDCSAKFWDFRNTKEVLKSIKAHSHWVWKIRFNKFHDLLVLTSGSDSRVVLHSLPSISSEAKKHMNSSKDDAEDDGMDKAATPIQEGILEKYEEHEDAVYGIEWSNSDPWTFASLSYDGRLVINKVPTSHKYKILL